MEFRFILCLSPITSPYLSEPHLVAANSGKYQQQNCQHQEHHSDWLAVYQLLTGALNSLSDGKTNEDTTHLFYCSTTGMLLYVYRLFCRKCLCVSFLCAYVGEI